MSGAADLIDLYLGDDCPHCGKPMRRDEQYVKFRAGNIPLFSLEVKLRAEWCANCDAEQPKITLLPTKTGKLP